MDKFDRIFQLNRILANRSTPIPLRDLMARLECSKATAYRLMRELESYLGASIGMDSDRLGYKYVTSRTSPTYELPGLWFSAHELQALVVLQKLLGSLQPGLLTEYLAPVHQRLNKLIAHKRLRLSEVESRIRVLSIASRAVGDSFKVVASGTLQRRKLRINYHSRGKDEQTERLVSPQRLVHYRDNWYLDAWDESREALRSFSVDRIHAVIELRESARDVPASDLDNHYAGAYGIFSGEPDKVAVLQFSARQARWVADERWHPRQEGRFLIDGQYELRIPYADSRELVMDILRHGAEVEVVAPPALRSEVRAALTTALARYAT